MEMLSLMGLMFIEEENIQINFIILIIIEN